MTVPMHVLSRCSPALWPLLSACLLVLSFPPFNLAVLAWIALVPLMVGLQGQPSVRSFLQGWGTGILFFAGLVQWIVLLGVVNWLEFSGAVLCMGLTVGLFGLAISVTSKHLSLPLVISAPILWVTLEYVRSHAGVLRLPWGLLAHSQYLNLPLIQMASWTGVYGVSFLLVMANAVIAQIILSIRERRHLTPFQLSRPVVAQAVMAAVIIGGCHVYGYAVLSASPSFSSLRIAVIQANIPQDAKWKPALRERHLAEHVALTKETARRDHPSLIVWPELSVQGRLQQDMQLRTRMTGLAQEVGGYLLVGSSVSPKFGNREFKEEHVFNSAFLIAPDGTVRGQYNKIMLLPFAEYLPYKDLVAWPKRYVSMDDTVPGTEYTLFTVDGHRIAALICWETIFPDLVREFVNRGAEVIVNMTNEAWFGDTAAPYQFLSMNVFRAVENRISIARSANTGVSAVIDAYGRIIGRVEEEGRDTFVEGSLTIEVPVRATLSMYSKYGDVGALVFIGAVLGVMMTVYRFQGSRVLVRASKAYRS